MTIRAATLADVPDLVRMGQRFVTETAYRDLVALNPDQIAATAARLVDGPGSIVLVSDHGRGLTGMIGLLLFSHYVSGEPIAGEVMWWVEPEARGAGVALLAAGEAWAHEVGAVRLQVIAPTAMPAVGRLYARRGYAPIEVAYQKAVNGG